MKGTLISGRELSEDLVSIWIELQQANPDLASPFFHPAFTKAIAAVRHDVEVAVLQSEGKIVAFFPFQRETWRGRSTSWRHNLGLSWAYLQTRFSIFAARTFRPDRLIAWEFDHLPASQVSFKPFRWCNRTFTPDRSIPGYGVRSSIARGPAPSKSRRSTVSCGVLNVRWAITVRTRVDRCMALSTVLNWKSNQYRKTGKPDLLAPGWVRRAVERHFRNARTRVFRCTFIALRGRSSGRWALCIWSRQAWHYWFPSYDLRRQNIRLD